MSNEKVLLKNANSVEEIDKTEVEDAQKKAKRKVTKIFDLVEKSAHDEEKNLVIFKLKIDLNRYTKF